VKAERGRRREEAARLDEGGEGRRGNHVRWMVGRGRGWV
jgi:hypothetical protein